MIGFIKYRYLALLHTYANKITGIALFCFPLLYKYFGLTITLYFIISLATLAALEELLINIKSKTLSLNKKSILINKA